MSMQSSIFTTTYVYTVSHNKLLCGKTSSCQTVLYVTHSFKHSAMRTNRVTATLCAAVSDVFPFRPLGLMYHLLFFCFSKTTRQISSSSSSEDTMAENVGNEGICQEKCRTLVRWTMKSQMRRLLLSRKSSRLAIRRLWVGFQLPPAICQCAPGQGT
ncbi:hypothetical protein XENOCAPTIV_002286 [Xenoophorus captivus]|uniref:Uncharacterized protein n=1 Tax=Xenoophorus captivus TaxID=1517983 RepID=A0ABV0RPR8_9TELE